MGPPQAARRLLRTARRLTAELAHDLSERGATPNFHRVARVTHGMLSARVYDALYRAALEAPPGDLLDVGTGRGASAVALGLAIRDGGRAGRVICIDQFYQHEAREPHRYTLASHGERAVALNVALFRENLARFGVADRVEVVPGRTTEAGDRVPDGAGLLFLDVDGCIDRDLAVFWPRLRPGAALVIDDYEDAVDAHGRERLARYAGMSAEARRALLAGLDDFERGRLLGKQVLVTRLVDHFVAAGVLERGRVIETTFFGRKPERAPAGEALFAGPALADLRAGIEAEFVRRAEALA